MKILDTFLLMLLIVMCADLLYLFYAGAWRDSIAAIEIIEIALLYGIGIMASWRLILKIKELL